MASLKLSRDQRLVAYTVPLQRGIDTYCCIIRDIESGGAQVHTRFTTHQVHTCHDTHPLCVTVAAYDVCIEPMMNRVWMHMPMSSSEVMSLF